MKNGVQALTQRFSEGKHETDILRAWGKQKLIDYMPDDYGQQTMNRHLNGCPEGGARVNEAYFIVHAGARYI